MEGHQQHRRMNSTRFAPLSALHDRPEATPPAAPRNQTKALTDKDKQDHDENLNNGEMIE
jgi:DNA gyrase inhibitor GyrI